MSSGPFLTLFRFPALPFDQWLKTPLGPHSSEHPSGPHVVVIYFTD